jgi:hypothetical protein
LDISFNGGGDLDEMALLAFVGANSAFVTTVYDQTGNARHLTQPTAASQPRLVNAGVIDRIATAANRAALRTDGVSQSIASPSYIIAQPFTRCSVLQFVTAANGTVMNSRATSPDTSLYMSGGALNMYAGSAVSAFKTGISANYKATVIETYNGASSVGSYNGATTTLSPGANGIDGIVLGQGGSSAGYTSELFGDVMVFPSALSTQDRLALEANQKLYWGTP